MFPLHKSTQPRYDMMLFCGQYVVQSNLAALMLLVHKSTQQRYGMTMFCAPCAQVNTAKVWHDNVLCSLCTSQHSKGMTRQCSVLLLHKSTQHKSSQHSKVHRGTQQSRSQHSKGMTGHCSVLLVHKSTQQRYDMTMFCAPCAQVNTAKV